MMEASAQARRIRDREEEQEALRHTGDWRQLKRLLGYLKPMRDQIILAIAFASTTALLMIAPMYMLMAAIDGPIARGDWSAVLWIGAVLFLIQIVLMSMDAWNHYFISKIGQRAMRTLRMDVFRHLQRQPLSFFDKNPVGRLVTRLTSDVNTLFELFSQGIVGVFQQMVFLVAVLVMLFWTNWKLTMWVLFVVPAVYVISWNFRKYVSIAYRIIRVRLARMNTFLQENLTGVKSVQAFTREKEQFARFEELNQASLVSQQQTVFQYAIYFPAVELLAALGFAMVIWRGGLDRIAATPEGAAMIGAVTVGQLALFVQALERFFMPIRDLSEKYNVVLSGIASGDRLFRLLDHAPEIADPPDPQPIGVMQHSIEFRNVWFAYKDEQWVLKDVSFTVPKGKSFAFVGATGSGKSTIMALLCRFYEPQKGDILIDGINIRRLRQEDLRKKIAIVLQDVFLFYGTVSGNIRLGDDTIIEDRVRNAAQAVGAEPFILRLPKGYDSGVKERGATLSTGQKQLLSFARALAFDPEILVLDEATASIDTETEQQIQRALETVLEGRTSLVIAHRLSTIQKADRILVLHHGQIAESGKHGELLAMDGLYRRLYQLQFSEAESA